jgi:hypothetical protein
MQRQHPKCGRPISPKRPNGCWPQALSDELEPYAFMMPACAPRQPTGSVSDVCNWTFADCLICACRPLPKTQPECRCKAGMPTPIHMNTADKS